MTTAKVLMPMDRVRCLFWDFDGTLYDSYPQICLSFVRGLRTLGLENAVPADELTEQIKHSVLTAVRWCSEQTGAPADVIYERYHGYHVKERTFPLFEGTADCLRALHAAGYRHYLYTHRDTLSVELLKQDGLWPLFSDAVTANDGFPAKPAPDALLALMRRNGLLADECAMVGDRDIDIEAGHRAGMKGILFGPDSLFDGCPCELRVRSMGELKRKLLP